MRFILLLFILFLTSCKKEYLSPYGYDHIKLYEYNKKPWDDDAISNNLYITDLSDEDHNLYPKIEKLNYHLKESFKSNLTIDSILFGRKYEKYRPEPTCPAGYNHILLLYNNTNIKYIIKFNEQCKELFLIDYNNHKSHFMKVGYEDFMKLIKK